MPLTGGTSGRLCLMMGTTMSEEQNEPLYIVVETFDAASGVMFGRTKIDHNNRADRQWLGKHCFWAFRNGRGVRTYPSQ